MSKEDKKEDKKDPELMDFNKLKTGEYALHVKKKK